MREQHHRIAANKLAVALLIAFVASAMLPKAHAAPRDSIGIEIRDGQEMIVHRIKAKETYFGVSRQYNVPVASIIDANSNKPLKIGDTLFVPTGRTRPEPSADAVADTVSDETPTPMTDEEIGEYTLFKVGPKETLFAVSQRFRISIASIKRANGLTSDTIQNGMLLKVPHNEIPEPPAIAEAGPDLSDILVDGEIEIDDPNAPQPNRFGIREHNDRGVGVWMDNLNQESGNMLALHQTAPVGTVIKITNPMTKLTTFVKVVGKFAENAETRDALIVISKSAASQIGVLDRRFQIEIAYGSPVSN